MNAPERTRVVIVDDDEDVVDRLTQILEDDYEVAATTDWGLLNHFVFTQGCGLILMDVNLPTLRGDQLVEILKRTGERLKKSPKVLYFSSADEDTMQRLVRETGADGYLRKSARAAEILHAVGSILGAAP